MKNYTKFIIFGLLCLHLQCICQIPNTIKVEDKVFGLSKIWSEAKYNFPYFKFLPNFNIDSLYQKSLIEVVNSKNDYEYYLSLMKFAASFHDNHTYVDYPDALRKFIYKNNFGNYKLFTNLIEGKAIISYVGNKNKDEIPIGSEILEIDSLNVSDYLDTYILPYISGSSDNNRRSTGVTRLLTGLKGTKCFIRLKTPLGQIKELKLIRSENKDQWYPVEQPDSYKYFPNKGITYIKIVEFSNDCLDSIKTHLADMRKAKGLVIDIRGNGGGSSLIAAEIAQYLVQDSILSGSKVKTRLNSSFYRYLGKRYTGADTIQTYDTVKRNYIIKDLLFSHNLMLEDQGNDIYPLSLRSEERIIKPTIILIDSQNASASEEFLIFLKNQKHILLMGEKTSGGNGQPDVFDLPGGGTASICLQYCLYPDGKDYYSVGIKPNIEVGQTIYDLINGKDTGRDRAMIYLSDILNHQNNSVKIK